MDCKHPRETIIGKPVLMLKVFSKYLIGFCVEQRVSIGWRWLSRLTIKLHHVFDSRMRLDSTLNRHGAMLINSPPAEGCSDRCGGPDFGLRGASPPLSAEANAKNTASRKCPGSLGRHHGFLPAFGAPAAQYFSGSQHPWAAQSPAGNRHVTAGRGNDATRKGSSFYNELRAAVTVIGGATLASVILPKCFAASMYRYCM
jgi:hypothetical protein